MMKQDETKSYTLIQPDKPVALVMDSPHSGKMYPADFRYECSIEDLRFAEDTHVDTLWSTAPSLGIPLLAARAARTYIDCNRSLDDIDPGTVEGGWPAAIQTSQRVALGGGLIWSKIGSDVTIFSGKLPQQAVSSRIADYYLPYHAALSHTLEQAYQRHKSVWHLNLHSMRSTAYEYLGISSVQPLADFVLGDRNGTSCDPEFTRMVEGMLRDLGYSVSINDPYKGAEILSRYGRPEHGRHSLQIEIRRDVYMDEKTRKPHEGFETLRANLALVTKSLVDYVVRETS